MEKQLPISVSTARGPEVALTDAAVRTVQINRVPGGGVQVVRPSLHILACFLHTACPAHPKSWGCPYQAAGIAYSSYFFALRAHGNAGDI